MWEIEAWMAGKPQFGKMDAEEKNEFNCLRIGVKWRAYLKVIFGKMFMVLSIDSK